MPRTEEVYLARERNRAAEWLRQTERYATRHGVPPYVQAAVERWVDDSTRELNLAIEEA